MRHLALLLALLPLPAAADCTPGMTVFSCQVGAKTLEICNETDLLIYKFGPPAAPELIIAEPLETVTFQPWPGVGSSMWEMLGFANEGYRYEVYTSVDRDPGADQTLQGMVSVIEGDQLVAEVRCDPGTVSNSLEGVWDLKEAIGMCWDFANQSWQWTCEN